MLKALYESVEQIPAELRGHYVELKDGPGRGRFALAVEPSGGFAFEHVDGLRNGIAEERSERKRLKEALAAFDGVDAAWAREAKTKYDEMLKWTPEDKVREKIAASVKDIKADLEGKLGERDKKLAAKDQAIRKLLIRAEAGRAIADLKGDTDLVMPLIETVADVVWSDGADLPDVVIMEDKKTPLITRESGKTGNMGVREYVEKVLRERHPRAFDGTPHSGAGSSGGGSGGGGGGSVTITEAELRNPQVYQARREAARKAGQVTPQVIPG